MGNELWSGWTKEHAMKPRRLERDVTAADFEGGDKAAAMTAEGHDPETGAKTGPSKENKVKTFSPEAYARYLELEKLGIRKPGLFGPRSEVPFLWNRETNDFEIRRVYLATQAGDPNRQLTVTDVNELFGIDETVPAGVEIVCADCGQPITDPLVQAAMVNRKDGTLFTERDGSVRYRGQTVVVGSGERQKHVAAHTGDCLFIVRTGFGNQNVREDGLLYCQNWAQGAARFAGIQGAKTEKITRRNERREEFFGKSGDENHRSKGFSGKARFTENRRSR